MKKKLALLIAFSLILSLIPAQALLAEDADDNGYDYEDVDNGYENGEDYENGEEDENGEDGDEEDYDEDEVAYDDEDYADYDDEDYNDEEADYADDEDDDDGFIPTVPVEIIPITAPIEVITLRFVIGETIFTRNDVEQPELDAAPFIAGGRTMVPIAAIVEGLGATVGWDHDTRTVAIRRGDINLTIPVDEELPGGMGTPVIIAGRTFVPLAYVSTELGAEVDWDPEARAVYVRY